jgi:hypothetical protein
MEYSLAKYNESLEFEENALFLACFLFLILPYPFFKELGLSLLSNRLEFVDHPKASYFALLLF